MIKLDVESIIKEYRRNYVVACIGDINPTLITNTFSLEEFANWVQKHYKDGIAPSEVNAWLKLRLGLIK